jgi:hypothetical protein
MRNRERWNKKENICVKNANETGVIKKGKSKIFKEKKTKDNITMKRIKKEWKGTRSTKYIRVYILKTSMCSPTEKPSTYSPYLHKHNCVTMYNLYQRNASEMFNKSLQAVGCKVTILQWIYKFSFSTGN